MISPFFTLNNEALRSWVKYVFLFKFLLTSWISLNLSFLHLGNGNIKGLTEMIFMQDMLHKHHSINSFYYYYYCYRCYCILCCLRVYNRKWPMSLWSTLISLSFFYCPSSLNSPSTLNVQQIFFEHMLYKWYEWWLAVFFFFLNTLWSHFPVHCFTIIWPFKSKQWSS